MKNVAKTYVIEYVPYAHRNERCAVGLLCVTANHSCTIHVANQLRKAKTINPSCDVESLRAALASIAVELSQDIDLLELYQSGFSGIKIASDAGSISYANQDELDEGVKWSMAVAVEPIKAKPTRERPSISRLFIDIKNSFDAYGWMGHTGHSLSDHRIIPRYPLLADEGLTVDFALKNGSFHCLQTVDYRHNPAQKRTEANAKLLTLGMAQHLTGHTTQKYTLIAGTDSPESKTGLKLAERVSNDVFVHESAEDMNRLLDIIAKAMGQDGFEKLTT
jgi:hypothetical protein